MEPEKPEFSVDSFLSNSFQKKWEKYEDYNFGFRPFLIKLKNSLEFIAFRDIDNADIIAGKEDFLYSLGSVDRTMRGKYYNGKERNESTVNSILFLKKNIEKRGGHFLAVIVPSKESVMPEKLPARYDNAVALNSDYRDLVNGYKKNNIPFIDLCEYFRKIRKSTTYPLFTKTGFHWSTYGASLAQDTLLKYCQSFLRTPMPFYERKGVEWSDTARDADADFEDVMNLLFSLEQGRYAYPKIEMNQASARNKRPKVIVIGDSFIWQIKNMQKLKYIFSEDSQFWYYFKTSFPFSDEKAREIKDIDVVFELESADFVLLAGSLGTLGDFPFGVTDYYHDNFSKPPIFSATGRNRKIFYLKAANDKYVFANDIRNNIVSADRDSVSSEEPFTLYYLDDNKYSICSHSHRFFSAELGQQNEITAIRDKIADWEKFTIIELDSNYVAFKAANGKYISLEKKSLQLFATAEFIGKNERFKMITK